MATPAHDWDKLAIGDLVVFPGRREGKVRGAVVVAASKSATQFITAKLLRQSGNPQAPEAVIFELPESPETIIIPQTSLLASVRGKPGKERFVLRRENFAKWELKARAGDKRQTTATATSADDDSTLESSASSSSSDSSTSSSDDSSSSSSGSPQKRRRQAAPPPIRRPHATANTAAAPPRPGQKAPTASPPRRGKGSVSPAPQASAAAAAPAPSGSSSSQQGVAKEASITFKKAFLALRRLHAVVHVPSLCDVGGAGVPPEEGAGGASEGKQRQAVPEPASVRPLLEALRGSLAKLPQEERGRFRREGRGVIDEVVAALQAASLALLVGGITAVTTAIGPTPFVASVSAILVSVLGGGGGGPAGSTRLSAADTALLHSIRPVAARASDSSGHAHTQLPVGQVRGSTSGKPGKGPGAKPPQQQQARDQVIELL